MSGLFSHRGTERRGVARVNRSAKKGRKLTTQMAIQNGHGLRRHDCFSRLLSTLPSARLSAWVARVRSNGVVDGAHWALPATQSYHSIVRLPARCEHDCQGFVATGKRTARRSHGERWPQAGVTSQRRHLALRSSLSVATASGDVLARAPSTLCDEA